MIKLPYTPVQAAALHAEEGRELPETLAGLPVVCSRGSGLEEVLIAAGFSRQPRRLVASAAA